MIHYIQQLNFKLSDNIYNKKACIALGKNAHGHSNAHWALSAMQLLVGVLFVVPCWLDSLYVGA